MSNRLGWVWCAVTGVLAASLVGSCSDAEETPSKPVVAAAAGEGGMAPVSSGGAGDGGSLVVTAAGMSNAAEAGAGGQAEPEPPEMPSLGLGCSTDAICGPGLTCLSAGDDFSGAVGGPPGGLCTKECEADAECEAFGEGAVCGTVAEIPLTNGYPTKPIPRVCLLGCSLGSHSGGGLTKCQGRTDLACRPFAAPDSVACGDDGECPADTECFRTRCRKLACGPRCNDNDDCETGRFCNPVSGLCSDNEPEAIPWGRECNDLAGSPGCGGGSCLVIYGDLDGAGGAGAMRLKGNCTQTCTLGQPCGEGAGACITARSPAYGSGDIGYCSPLCNCDSECLNPVDRCIEWTNPALAKAFGSRGRCDYPWPNEPTLDCPGAGGAGQGGASSGGAGGAP